MRGPTEFSNVETRGVRHMNYKRIWEYNKSVPSSFKFHDMWHFVPTKTNKSGIVFWNITPYHYIGLIIWFPWYLNIINYKINNAFCKIFATIKFWKHVLCVCRWIWLIFFIKYIRTYRWHPQEFSMEENCG